MADINGTVDALATYADQHPGITNFAAARHERHKMTLLRFAKVFKLYAGRDYPPRNADPTGNHIITACMDIVEHHHQVPAPSSNTADTLHIKGNRLALDFADTMHMLETENEPHISWSPSRKRLAHNYTTKWLGACLRFNPTKDRLEPKYRKDKEISDINALLAPLRTCHNFIADAWPDKTSTRRHLHLAFESGCISCTRQGSCKEGGTGVDFSTCCL